MTPTQRTERHVRWVASYVPQLHEVTSHTRVSGCEHHIVWSLFVLMYINYMRVLEPWSLHGSTLHLEVPEYRPGANNFIRESPLSFITYGLTICSAIDLAVSFTDYQCFSDRTKRMNVDMVAWSTGRRPMVATLSTETESIIVYDTCKDELSLC